MIALSAPPVTEAQIAAGLDHTLATLGLFHVYPEVTGTLTQPRPGQPDKNMRIDRLLLPTHKLIDSGWTSGAIGIEVKRSGDDKTLGPAVSQAMDYTRTTFTLPSGVRITPNLVFLYPFEKPGGPIASVMAQNNVGTAKSNAWDPLMLQLPHVNVLHIKADGTWTTVTPTSGRKAGSR